ncbi:MAG: protein-disulfide reductase DsbD family protein [Hyphomicrobiaceae bacterium]
MGRRSGDWRVLLGFGLGMLCLPVSGAEASDRSAPPLASSWTREQAAQVRLIAGSVAAPGHATRVYAGLEIELDDGWKTYWRNPGTSGVPPQVDLDGSENLAKAELMFPAPIRFKGRDGDTIGYKKHVVLPVALTPKDPSKPIVLKVAAEFGLCREVCIPVTHTLGLTVPQNAAVLSSTGRLSEALSKVPVEGASGAKVPRLERVTARLTGEKPEVVIDARFPGQPEKGDIFLEAPEGRWIPLPQPAGQSADGSRRFVVDLSDGADVADLKGRPIRATLVGAEGQAEATFDLVEAR